MQKKVLIALYKNEVAHRFDLATEVLLVSLKEDGAFGSEKTIVLPHGSAEDLCHLILTEEVSVVICGGIEEEFFQYLTWKKVEVIDSVMGPWARALAEYRGNRLEPAMVLFERPERQTNV